MKEYIELGAAIKKIRDEGIYGEGHSDEERENDVIEMLESIPAADVRYVIHSEWEITEVDHAHGHKCFHCPECGHDEWRYEETNFCPNCGVDMREVDHETD